MSEAVLVRRLELEPAARAALHTSARLWRIVTALGQWVFAFCIAAFFGPLMVGQGLEGLKQGHLFNGFIPGDSAGNSAWLARL